MQTTTKLATLEAKVDPPEPDTTYRIALEVYYSTIHKTFSLLVRAESVADGMVKYDLFSGISVPLLKVVRYHEKHRLNAVDLAAAHPDLYGHVSTVFQRQRGARWGFTDNGTEQFHEFWKPPAKATVAP